MYSLNMPVSRIRTKIRQEFERHRYVAQLPAVDVLLFQSHQEFQVCNTQSRSNRELTRDIGNVELLETTFSCVKILSRGRRSESKTTEQLHECVLRGI